MSGATKRVHLHWTGEGLAFEGGPVGEGAPTVVVDGDASRGPSPMDHLLLGLAGCMGVDVRTILEKSRVPLRTMRVEVEGDRAPEPPRRYVAVRMVYHLEGPREEDRAKVDRAVALSRDRYCSVLHSLRPDLDLSIRVARD